MPPPPTLETDTARSFFQIPLQHFFGNVSWKSKYNIEFKGLNEGSHDFEFEVDNKFFEHFEESLVDNGNILVKVALEKRSAFIKINFKIKGWLELTCDRCLDNYRQKIKPSTALIIERIFPKTCQPSIKAFSCGLRLLFLLTLLFCSSWPGK